MVEICVLSNFDTNEVYMDYIHKTSDEIQTNSNMKKSIKKLYMKLEGKKNTQMVLLLLVSISSV